MRACREGCIAKSKSVSRGGFLRDGGSYRILCRLPPRFGAQWEAVSAVFPAKNLQNGDRDPVILEISKSAMSDDRIVVLVREVLSLEGGHNNISAGKGGGKGGDDPLQARGGRAGHPLVPTPPPVALPIPLLRGPSSVSIGGHWRSSSEAASSWPAGQGGGAEAEAGGGAEAEGGAGSSSRPRRH